MGSIAHKLRISCLARRIPFPALIIVKDLVVEFLKLLLFNNLYGVKFRILAFVYARYCKNHQALKKSA